ncbi:hypothetical protein D3C84_1001150 [compost metagenome]
MELARGFIHAQVGATGLIPLWPVIEAFFRPGIFRGELITWGQHLFHQQAGGNGLEHIVHCLSYSGLISCRFGDQVGEARALLTLGIPRGTANDLHDFGQARTVADGQRMLAPDPVKAFLRHA